MLCSLSGETRRQAISRVAVAVIVLVLIVVAAVAVVYGTRSTSTTSTTSSTLSSVSTSSGSTSVLNVDEPSAPQSADPDIDIDNNGIEIIMAVDQPLIFFNYSDNDHFIPVLAKSWTSNPDGLNYTFYLRSGVYFSNGDAFNAYVVWYNIYRSIILAQTSSYLFYQYFNFTGVTAGDLNSLDNPQNSPNGNATLLQIMENPNNAVQVINATEVEFNLDVPFAAFLQTVCSPPWVFTDPYLVQEHGGVVANTPNSWMAVNGTTVGDGPYVVKQYVLNTYTELVANPNYWGANITGDLFMQAPKIPEVIVNYKSDELTRELDIESNTVQGAAIDYTDVASVLKTDSDSYLPQTGISGSVEALALNTLKAPLNNSLVRAAIIAAVNVTQIQQVAYAGYVTSLVGPDLNGFFGYNTSISPPAYNLAEAKSLLAEAGYPDGKGLPAITFAYPTSSYQTQIAELLQQDLSQIGLTVSLQGYQEVYYLDSIEGLSGTNSTAADIISEPGWTYYPDVSGYWYLVDGSLGAIDMLNNATINNVINLSNTQLNSTLRAQEISQATVLIEEDSAMIWLGQDIDYYGTGYAVGPTVWNSCVAGLWYNTDLGGVPFNAMYYTCTPK